MKRKNELEHRDRKNGFSRDEWKKRKKEANSARGRQVFMPADEAEHFPPEYIREN